MAGRPLSLRCTSKKGQHILSGLTLSSRVSDLKQKISELTNIHKDWIKIRQGYPPKEVDLSEDDKELSYLPFRSGDSLIVEEDRSLQRVVTQKRMDDVIQKQSLQSRGMLLRKVVPADNSCLFTSIHALTNNAIIDPSCAKSMRDLIAGVVLSDPEMYSSAFLGMSNNAYCKWIMNSDSWGGAIEIAILSKYYEMEIDVVDTQSGRIDRFGEDQNYKERILVIYDGIHYDPLMLEPFENNGDLQTIFSTNDASLLSQAMEIADEAKASKQFTDVANFTLKCLICQKRLTGQSDAQQHAKATGHISFGEV